MKPEIKQKWVSALRSGDYEQGSNWLYSGQGYCCLGVLCDIYAKENKESWQILDEDGELITEEELSREPHSMDYFFFDDETEFLPESVMKWSGVPYDPSVVIENEEGERVKEQIVVLNDSGMSFNELADLIEQQF